MGQLKFFFNDNSNNACEIGAPFSRFGNARMLMTKPDFDLLLQTSWPPGCRPTGA